MLRQLMLDSRYSGLRTNLLLNPSCETAAVNVLTRLNQATVPNGTTYVTAQGTTLGWNNTRWFGPPGAGTYTNVTGATDGPIPQITAYARKTWTTAGIGGATGMNTNAWTGFVAGQVYTVSGWIRSSITRTSAGFTTEWRDATGVFQTMGQASNTIQAGVWYRFSSMVTAPSTGAVSVAFILDINGGGENIPIGTTVDCTGLLVEQAGAFSSLLRTNWVTNGSFERNINGWATTGSATAVQSNVQKSGGQYSMAVTAANNDSGINQGVTDMACTPGQKWSFSVNVFAPAGTTMRLILDHYNGGTYITQNQTLFTATGVWQTVKLENVTVAAAATNIRLGVRLNGAQTSLTFYVDDFMAESGVTSVGGVFHGNNSGVTTEFSWTGTPFASTSQQRNLPTGQLNPYFDGSTKMALRTNMFLNPHAAATGGGWASSYNGGARTESTQSTGGPDNGSYFRAAITTVSTIATPYLRMGGGGLSQMLAPIAGQPVTASVWFRSSVAGDHKLIILGHDATGAGWNPQVNGPTFTVQPGVWTRLTASLPSWSTAAGAARATIVIDAYGADNITRWQVGSTLEATMLLVEQSATVGSYFDGTTRPAVRTNLSYNPRGVFPNVQGEYGDRYAWTATWTTGITDHPMGFTTARRATAPASPSQGGGRGIDLYGNPDVIVYPRTLAVVPGQTYTISTWVRTSRDRTLQIGARSHTGTIWVDIYQSGPFFSVPANIWTRISRTYTVPATSNYLTARLHINESNHVQGDWMETSGLLIEQASTVGTYFDGTTAASGGPTYAWQGTANTTPSYSYVGNESVAWVGTANASPSYVYDNDFVSYVWTGTANLSTSAYYSTGVASVNASGLHTVQSTRWAATGTKSMRQIPRNTSADNYTVVAATAAGGGGSNGVPILVLGKTYTFTAVMHQEAPFLNAGNGNGSRQVVLAGLAPWVTQRSVQPANVAGDSVHTITFTVPSTNYGQIRLYHGHPMITGQPDLWWDNLILEETGSQKVYFDGTFPNAKWSGTAHASTSVGYGFAGL